jgi:hypothetical protein
MDALIGELTEAAHGAIEQAAAEAARAAALASLERETAALAEARRLGEENGGLRKGRVKAMVISGIVCFFGGLAVGAGTTAILAGGR